MRPIGTAEELQRRRLRAVELVEQGESPDDVARFLGCGRSSVYTWVKLARQSPGGLAAKPHAGPKPRLTAEQLKELEGLLLQGAKAHGWRTELWTAARAAELIERHFKVRFHPEHVRKLAQAAAELDQPEAAAEGQGAGRGGHRPLKASGTAGDHPAGPAPQGPPGVPRRVGVHAHPDGPPHPGPRGKTPILKSWDRHDRISAISAVTVSPKRRRLGLYFRLLPDDTNAHGEDTVDVPPAVAAAHPRADDDPLGPGQHPRPLQGGAGLPGRAPRGRDREVPGYAPETNPDEMVWQHTKHGRLANFAPEDTAELRAVLVEEFGRIQGSPSCCRHSSGTPGSPSGYGDCLVIGLESVVSLARSNATNWGRPIRWSPYPGPSSRNRPMRHRRPLPLSIAPDDAPICRRSPGAGPSPGIRSSEQGSSWASPPGSRPMTWPSGHSPTARRSGGPAAVTRTRACPASWRRRNAPGGPPGFPPLQRAEIAGGRPGADRQGAAHHPLDQPRPGPAGGRGRHRPAHQRPDSIRTILDGVDLQPHRTRYWRTTVSVRSDRVWKAA